MQWPKQIRLRERSRRLRQTIRNWLAVGSRQISRRWPLVNGFRPATAKLEAGAWPRRLEEEKAFLLRLVQDMEQEFLEIGQEFERWSPQLQEIQQECRSLSELTLGQTQEAPVQFAFQLLKKAEDLVLASYDQYDQVFASFSELRQRLAELSERHDELMRVLLPLNFITISVRIEASRHTPEVQEVFSALAASVGQTVNEVRGTLDRQFNELAASERIAAAVMEQVSASIQQHRQEVSSTIQTIRDHLGALNQAVLAAGAGATNISQLNQSVARHIGSLVMAQQCQDITRQKIEHVGEAIDEIRTHLSGEGMAGAALKPEMCQFLFQASRIQLKQTQDVFEELGRAAESLQSGIHDLRRDAGAAAGVVVNVGETMLKANVAQQCQVSMGRIGGTIEQAVQKTAEILLALEPLQARFLNCTQQATALASDVRIAALNAQVFAIHTPDGTTLEVLAGNMRTTSDETMAQVEKLGSGLQNTAAMINNQRQRLKDFEELAQAEQTILTEETAVSQERLLSLDKAIPILIGRITEQQTAFKQSTEKVQADIRFPASVAAASKRSIGFFQELADWSGAEGGNLSVASATAQKIDSLKLKYTMESERQAHAAATTMDSAPPAALPDVEMFEELAPVSSPRSGNEGGMLLEGEPVKSAPASAGLPATANTSPLPAPPPAAANPPANGGLGDNVELF
jgi:hypothetical protein